ncbi:MAG: tol-pal system protein YbgF [Myxococcota bacterium]
MRQRWLPSSLLVLLAALGVGCASNTAKKEDVEALRKDLREQNERQLLMERRLADMDARLTLLTERVASRSAQEGTGARPNLGVVRVGPQAQPQPQPQPAPRQAANSFESFELQRGGSPAADDLDDENPRVAVDRQVLAEEGGNARPEALAAQEEEVVARTDPKTQYNLSMRKFKARQYAEAARGFEEVADRWPEHPLADNAVYWTGVCYLQQGEMALAINELQKVPVRYPKSDKVPDALFQLAEAYQRVGDMESAKAMLTQVVEMYPTAEAAGPAREGLARLNKQ